MIALGILFYIIAGIGLADFLGIVAELFQGSTVVKDNFWLTALIWPLIIFILGVSSIMNYLGKD